MRTVQVTENYTVVDEKKFDAALAEAEQEVRLVASGMEPGLPSCALAMRYVMAQVTSDNRSPESVGLKFDFLEIK